MIKEFSIGDAVAAGRTQKWCVKNLGDRGANVAHEHWESCEDESKHREGHVGDQVAELVER